MESQSCETKHLDDHKQSRLLSELHWPISNHTDLELSGKPHAQSCTNNLLIFTTTSSQNVLFWEVVEILRFSPLVFNAIVNQRDHVLKWNTSEIHTHRYGGRGFSSTSVTTNADFSFYGKLLYKKPRNLLSDGGWIYENVWSPSCARELSSEHRVHNDRTDSHALEVLNFQITDRQVDVNDNH